ncbi:hypothetical protein MpV1_143 [Micromonas sp. RCC1109 virus MpV1]|uniref:hypothetical protein n=1 Tax=Micromonas sp. RCC1109 virus MpV1 TaxID=880161 RepID=UPI0001EF4508|nr:hypothetical protein MpV1_143 [Micromonas sp. RCC1109 virus MpV1]ADQ91066.1 hypothetical protein MpV1_143 [Micromonas sp. RCC1109 virus MpV1]
MSEYMLNDDDAINDVNPFVTHDFSLPGGVRETGDFADFVEMEKTVQFPVNEKSVFCSAGLCKDETKPCLIDKKVRPQRNIDYGFTRQTKKVKVGVSNKSVPYFWIFLGILIIALVLLFLRR